MTYQGYLIDLDGTMYRGDQPIPSARDFVMRLQARKIPFLFITNNATKSPKEIQDQLARQFDIHVQTDQIYTSALALRDYLLAHHQEEEIYAIGEPSFRKLLMEEGLNVSQSESASILVQSLDRHISYEILSQAVHVLNNGAKFYVTNDDRLIPNGQIFDPSSGAITAFLSYACDRQPFIFGKPHRPIVEGALHILGMDKTSVVLIGDNYDTDILSGIHMQLDTIMVLTGVSSREDLSHVNHQPTYVVRDLSEWEL